MSRFKNIATKITLMAIMLLSVLGYASAQNTSKNPYLDSEHKYSISMIDAGNDVKWHYQINGGAEVQLNDANSWVVFDETGGVASLEITFISSIFDLSPQPLPTVTLIYSEEDANSCVARRSLDVTLVANQFNLEITDLGNECNSNTGITWIAFGDLSTYTRSQTVDFNVVLNKVGLRVQRWRFTGTFFKVSGVNNNLVSDLVVRGLSGDEGSGATNAGMSWAIVPDGNTSDNTITIEVSIPEANRNAYALLDSDNVTFSVELNGRFTENVTVRFYLEDGYGVTGTNYPSGVEDANDGNTRQDDRVIYGIPSTSTIVAN